MIVAFPDNDFNGHLAPELAKLIENGTIRLIDLLFIAKDADGNVAAVEYDEHEALAPFAELDGDVGGIISHEDIEHAAIDLPANTSAALLIWEDLWATPLVEALRNSGGVLVEGSRIPHDLIEDAFVGLPSAT